MSVATRGNRPARERRSEPLADVLDRAAGRHGPHASDWWTRGVAPIGLIHLALYLTLQARPGAFAVTLWRWGPPLVVAMAGALLVAVLLSALRGRSWSRRRTLGFAGLCVIVATLGVYQTFPSAYDEHPSAIPMRLPLDGPVTVAWGGATRAVNYHVGSPAERWAYDLLVTMEGSSHAGSGRAVSDYHAYDQPVRVPAAGWVVAIHDGEPDARPGEPDRDRRGGNYVVIEVAPGQFLFLVHLKAGSIRIEPGQRVTQGELVARVGNSGNSSEPHVHVHLQDTPVPQAGQGIPLQFSSYATLPDGLHVVRGIPTGGIRHGRFLGEVVETALDP